MSNDEIKELIQLVVESGIAELELERGGDRVRIRRTVEPRPLTMESPRRLRRGEMLSKPRSLAGTSSAGAQRE